ncbi:MAG: hypothetical protein JWM82_468 [Myxococcales bacterium]|nr:hypothetical protein [Myxococcales bacterium]
MADALRAAGEAVEIHDDHFAADAADQTWLAEVGTKGWVVLSKDDRIRRNPVEREALLAAGIAAFFLGRSDLRGIQMAAALVGALPAMKRALRRFPVPFIAGVSIAGDIHVFESDGQRHTPPKRLKR